MAHSFENKGDRKMHCSKEHGRKFKTKKSHIRLLKNTFYLKNTLSSWGGGRGRGHHEDRRAETVAHKTSHRGALRAQGTQPAFQSSLRGLGAAALHPCGPCNTAHQLRFRKLNYHTRKIKTASTPRGDRAGHGGAETPGLPELLKCYFSA